MTIPSVIHTWQMVQPWSVNKETGEKIPGKLERTTIPVPELKPGEVLVEIAGCGVCHTDLGYFYDGVPTVSKPPLTLGHEISGTVVAGDPAWVGKEVIIPAVLPCNNCPICAQGRGNRCLNQKMPGNSHGIYGGFSSHIPVPAQDLCVVENRGTMPLSHLAVIADAIATPYQAAVRADLKPGDYVVVVGCTGGVGVYMTQMAKAWGAKVVVGIGRHPEKLQRALQYGADFVISSQNKTVDEVRNEFRALSKAQGWPNYGWKIFEVTGQKMGQDIALSLLGFIGKLIVIGYGTAVNEYAISRLMAFDAEIIGTWACLPKYYPEVLKMVLDGRIQIEPFIEVRPMSQLPAIFEEAHSGTLLKRIVVTPDF